MGHLRCILCSHCCCSACPFLFLLILFVPFLCFSKVWSKLWAFLLCGFHFSDFGDFDTASLDSINLLSTECGPYCLSPECAVVGSVVRGFGNMQVKILYGLISLLLADTHVIVFFFFFWFLIDVAERTFHEKKALNLLFNTHTHTHTHIALSFYVFCFIEIDRKADVWLLVLWLVPYTKILCFHVCLLRS